MAKKEDLLICFDMDNTLVYADKVHIEAYNKAFILNGLPAVNKKKLKGLFGMMGHKIIKKLFPKLSKKKIKKIQADHNRIVVKETAKYAKLVKGVKPVLKKLKKKFKLALVSNCTHAEIVATLKATGIDKKFFHALVGNDEVVHGKPNADELLLAQKLTKCKSGFMVGDTIYDVKAGKAAKLRTVAVLTGNHTRAMLKKENPDFILKSVDDLPKIIL